MKKIITGLLSLFACLSSFAQAGDLPAGYLGSVLNYSWGTQTYNYSFTPTTTGVDYVGFAFRQDPGFWTFTNPVVTAGNSSTNLLINGNLQYGGSLTVNTSNYGQMYIQAPSDWGVWYQNGTYPGAAGYWSPGQWYDGAVGSYDGIYQGISVRAGTTYNISFSLSGTNPSSNPSIEVGTYMGTCAAGTNVFTCTPNSSASMSAIAAPQATQSVGGAPPPPPPTSSGPVFTDLRFGRYQVADSQWNVSSCTQTNTCQIYSTNPGTAYRIPWTSGQWNWQPGQYIQFLTTGNSANPYEAKVYNSDGTLAGTLGTGHILSMGTDTSGHSLFFFVGNDNNTGQLFSTNYGFSGNGGYTWTGTLNPNTSQVDTFASSGSTTPLAAGATAGGGTPAPTITSTSTADSVSSSSSVGATTATNNQYTYGGQNYTVSGTMTPTTVTVTTTPVTTTHWSDGTTTTSNGTPVTTTSTTYSYTVTGPATTPVSPYTLNNKNGVYITQVNAGSNNNVTVDQSGHGNYSTISLSGSNNTINAGQGYTYNSLGVASESLTPSNYNVLGLSVSGNANRVTNSQLGLSNSAIVSSTGNSNIITTSQNGNNNQIYSLLSGNGNTASIIQTGNTNLASVNLYGNNNNASVSQSGNGSGLVLNLTNAGGPNTATIVQTGTGDMYSLQQTCTTPSGCSVTAIRNH